MQIPGRNKYESATTETKQVQVCVNCNRLQHLVSLYFSTKYQSAGTEAEMVTYIQTKLLADSLNFTTAQIQTALDTCKNSWKKNVGLHAELGGYVNMNQSPQVHFRTDNFSLEAWVFPEAINNTIQHIVANHTIRPISGIENMGGYRLYMLSGKVYLQMGDYSGALASGGCAQIRTINTISANEWHHIIAIRSGNNAANFKIYVDGVLQQTEVADYSYLNNGNVYNESNSGRLVYGNRSGSGIGESFIGFIKNVKIYKKVMTATEALANYTSCSGAPADTTNLVLWTRLENGSGTVVSDSSRFATNGIMTASAGWGGGVGIAANTNCIGEKEGVLCVTKTVTVPVVKGYRYGFNGKENDNEPKGIEGSQQDYGMRIYDPRIGRFLSVDPLEKEYPWYTPYQFAGNKPIVAIDLDGLEEWMANQDNQMKQRAQLQQQVADNQKKLANQVAAQALAKAPVFRQADNSYEAQQRSKQLKNQFAFNKEMSSRAASDPLSFGGPGMGLGLARDPLIQSTAQTVLLGGAVNFIANSVFQTTTSSLSFSQQFLLKSSIDAAGQSLISGPKKIDFFDAVLSGLPITPGISSLAGAAIDVRPFSAGDRVRSVGINKPLLEFTIDASVKYSFGSGGLLKTLKEGYKGSFNLKNPGELKLYDVSNYMIQIPFSLAGKETSFGIKEYINDNKKKK